MARRTVLTGLGGTALAGGLPGDASASGREEQHLREGIKRLALPQGAGLSPSVLELVGYGRRGARLHAVVRLTWPPGTRQMGFTAEAWSQDTAVADVLDQVQSKLVEPMIPPALRAAD